ncbi:MAG: efflux RND transporter periplasmic adaptor subunit [Proteobacteria bacterium]|nr:efflux RND transporter periplasmic adaptor subunit [Pseudomonadota bacterium]
MIKKYLASKDKWPLLGGGIVVGLLIMWVLFKIFTPVMKSVCTFVLESEEEKMISRRERVRPVEAVEVKLGTISKRIATVGKLRANESVTIRSETHGRIKEIAFKEGTDVKKDDVLIRFEDSDAQAEWKQAQAELILRKGDFERISKLQSQHIESVKKREEAKAQFAMAEAKVEAAKARLEKTVIVAPFEGTIGLIDVSPGTYIQVGQDLVTLVDNTPIKLDFKISEKYLNDIGVGQQADVRLDGFPSEVFRATVEALDSKVDHLSHSISVRAVIPNDDKQLRAGLFANVNLIIGEKGDAILIPESALEREGQIEYVWVIQKGKAGRRPVLTGTKENYMVEIIAGLREGELVVTAGQLRLGDGMAVKITNMEPEKSPENITAVQEASAQENQQAPEQPTQG